MIEILLWEQDVPGSNPGAPTSILRGYISGVTPFLPYSPRNMDKLERKAGIVSGIPAF
jgi:hypothetical protein